MELTADDRFGQIRKRLDNDGLLLLAGQPFLFEFEPAEVDIDVGRDGRPVSYSRIGFFELNLWYSP